MRMSPDCDRPCLTMSNSTLQKFTQMFGDFGLISEPYLVKIMDRHGADLDTKTAITNSWTSRLILDGWQPYKSTSRLRCIPVQLLWVNR